MKRAFTSLATTLVFASLSLALVGCSPAQHQVIEAGEDCRGCHSEEKPTYEPGAEKPSNAVESGSRVTVETDAGTIAICRPVLTAEDGSSFVPEKASEVPVVDGQATVELEDGLWALCVDEGDTARAKLVHVDSSSASGAVVKL